MDNFGQCRQIWYGGPQRLLRAPSICRHNHFLEISLVMVYFGISETRKSWKTFRPTPAGCLWVAPLAFSSENIYIYKKYVVLVGKTEVCVLECLHGNWPSSLVKSCDAIRKNKYYDRIIHAYVHALKHTVSVAPRSSHCFVVTGLHFPRQLWLWHLKSLEKCSVCVRMRWGPGAVTPHQKSKLFLWSRARKIAR